MESLNKVIGRGRQPRSRAIEDQKIKDEVQRSLSLLVEKVTTETKAPSKTVGVTLEDPTVTTETTPTSAKSRTKSGVNETLGGSGDKVDPRSSCEARKEDMIWGAVSPLWCLRGPTSAPPPPPPPLVPAVSNPASPTWRTPPPPPWVLPLPDKHELSTQNLKAIGGAVSPLWCLRGPTSAPPPPPPPLVPAVSNPASPTWRTPPPPPWVLPLPDKHELSTQNLKAIGDLAHDWKEKSFKPIDRQTLEALTESKVAVVMTSDEEASSVGFLEELLVIPEFQEKRSLTVIPILLTKHPLDIEEVSQLFPERDRMWRTVIAKL
ncbi:hypothetical protein F2Q69_00063163 [Brassica cretica]|uniref:TIR domain-containing protein n=1 Tax=Brassica cretica TaxID=69181 RepID=A0A8S9RNE1_BRACR|nr:hypothetical protein F2Q69_00063163 [Brassica cretica]